MLKIMLHALYSTPKIILFLLLSRSFLSHQVSSKTILYFWNRAQFHCLYEWLARCLKEINQSRTYISCSNIVDTIFPTGLNSTSLIKFIQIIVSLLVHIKNSTDFCDCTMNHVEKKRLFVLYEHPGDLQVCQ